MAVDIAIRKPPSRVKMSEIRAKQLHVGREASRVPSLEAVAAWRKVLETRRCLSLALFSRSG